MVYSNEGWVLKLYMQLASGMAHAFHDSWE